MIQNIYKIKAALMVMMNYLSSKEDLTPKIQRKFLQLVCLNEESRPPKDELTKFLERDEKKLLYESCIPSVLGKFSVVASKIDDEIYSKAKVEG